MFGTYSKILLLLISAIMLTASAWPQGKGKFLNITSFSTISYLSDSSIKTIEDLKEKQKYYELAAENYSEFGYRDDITIPVKILFQDFTNSNNEAPINLSVGVNKLLASYPVMLSIEPRLNLPGEFSLGLHLGKDFNIYKASMFIDSSIWQNIVDNSSGAYYYTKIEINFGIQKKNHTSLIKFSNAFNHNINNKSYTISDIYKINDNFAFEMGAGVNYLLKKKNNDEKIHSHFLLAIWYQS